MGLDLNSEDDSFQVLSVEIAAKEGINKVARPQIIFSLIQERQRRPGSGGPPLNFQGGCTVIADRLNAKVQYYVTKNVLSTWRLERQKAFASRQENSLTSVYLNDSSLSGVGERFAMMHSDGEVY
jgi:hypothetical protein